MRWFNESAWRRAALICGAWFLSALNCVVGADGLSAVRGVPLDEELRSVLFYMRQLDQDARQEVIESGFSTVSMFKMLLAVDVPNTHRMKKILAAYGWPGKSLVGKDGAAAVWLLVQHAGHDPPFMEHCLALMRSAVERGEASPKNLAYLTDRVRVHQGKPQRYGTQFKLVGPEQRLVADPIEDEAHVDERRRSVGLSTMAEQDRALRATYRLTPAETERR